jgi:queuosine precursor transporter
MNFSSRKDTLFLVLCGFFITNAIVAELIGGKLVQVGPFVQSIGILPWPIVFLSTDLINEYFGKKGVIKISVITVVLIAYTFLILLMGMQFDSASFSMVKNEHFNAVFGQSMWIIVGSITAFIVSQFVDAFVFFILRDKTKGKHLWLRATGSTVVSQLIDTFIVQFIAFVIPGVWTLSQFFQNASAGYVFKLMIAVALTPLIYLAHYLIDRYLGRDKVEVMNNSEKI